MTHVCFLNVVSLRDIDRYSLFFASPCRIQKFSS